MADGGVQQADFRRRVSVADLRAQLAEAAALPEEAPMGLNGCHYTDADFFEHECETVLRNGWHCVARADELPSPGDFLTLTLLGEPIIVVRNDDRLRALSNVCRHRGMPLVQGAGRAKLFVCPYHAWSYRTDGRLQRASRMENAGFDAKTCRLPRFACVERYGFVYVCLSETPPDIDQDLHGLDAHLSPYEPDAYRIVHSAYEAWQTNWKCLVENFMEGYHLSVVHPRTLHGYTPTELSKKGPSGEGFTSYFAHYPESAGSRGTGAKGLPQEDCRRSFLFATFPCQVTSIAPSLMVSLSLVPRSAEQVDVRWTMSVYGDALDQETIDARIALWTEVNREDREKLELMQGALRSRHATGGPLAGEDYEGTVKDFLKWLARRDREFV